MSMFAQQSAQTRSNFFTLALPVPPRIVSGQNRNISRLVFFAFFALLFALVVFAHDFALRVELEPPFFPVLLNDGFIVRALFFPTNDFAAFGLRIGSLLHRGGYVRTVDGFFLLFISVSLRDSTERESGADRCDCEQLWCIHGYLFLTNRSQELFEYREPFTRGKLIDPIAGHRLTSSLSSLRSREAQTEKNKERADSSIEPLRNRFVRSQSFAKSGSKPRQDEAPDCAGGHKCETENQKCQHLDVRYRVDELRKES